jgi:hypothetical protein
MRDVRTGVTGAIALLLTVTACLAVLIGVARGVGLTESLTVVGTLLAPATALLVDPGRHGRTTDPVPRVPQE